MAPKKEPVRLAVVGLGWFGQSAVLPAFKRLKNAKLCALVSGDERKRARLSAKHKVSTAVGYEGYVPLLRSGSIDAVYLALPNTMHAEYAVLAAKAGIHVLCEKPMAPTEAECARMIEAARLGNVKLMIAYRLHFEAANLMAVRLATSNKLGELRYLTAAFSLPVEAGNSRLSGELAGGPLNDIGVYCINAARALFRDEPIEAMAFAASRAGDDRFESVHEQVAALLRFPRDRLASFVVGFGASSLSRLDLVGTRGSLHLDPAFHHASDLVLEQRIGARHTRHRHRKRDQVAAEIEYFAQCVLDEREPSPSGLEGLADVRILRALDESIARGAPVGIAPVNPGQRPDPRQERHVPAHAEPSLVHAQSPSR
jgi:glucose-fructose oxidoreductase